MFSASTTLFNEKLLFHSPLTLARGFFCHISDVVGCMVHWPSAIILEVDLYLRPTSQGGTRVPSSNISNQNAYTDCSYHNFSKNILLWLTLKPSISGLEGLFVPPEKRRDQMTSFPGIIEDHLFCFTFWIGKNNTITESWTRCSARNHGYICSLVISVS